MRESMAHLTPRFSTNRMLREYTERYYLPAARAYARRAGDLALTRELVQWRHAMETHWGALHFGNVDGRRT